MTDENTENSHTGTGGSDDEGGQPSLHQRVADLEETSRSQRDALKRAERDLWIGIVVLVGGLMVAMVAGAFSSKAGDVATTRDDNLDALLAEGVHCYASPEEMAATRQRALAAIDRINWDRDHPTPTTTESHPDPMRSTGSNGSERPKSIAVVKATTYPGPKRLDANANANVDVNDSQCFGIEISSW